ncbi:MAG: ArsR family transcriptional regulator [Elusimicrobia bacterium HGW-Elusimicrobia-1]|jgi:DNA-binding transcriptional ArsR family regulator|nr:MAG: ArsR family transcriptional regulator [Elusimicrobia bacterium HGW-Elusimicrobia-1]
MLESILGNKTVEKILLYLERYGQGYPQSIAQLFGVSLNGIQQQLKRLENGGVISSNRYGKLRLYTFNPRYYFLPELRAILKKALDALPEAEIKKYYMLRTRPRRSGKPL